MATGLTIIEAALQEIGVLGAGESAGAADAAWGLAKLNRIIDQWNARSLNVYSVSFVTQDETPVTPLTLHFTANQQKYTFGPSGNFIFSQRPVRIEYANVILNNVSPVVRVPMEVRDDAWWAGVSVRGITSTFPTDVYYSPDLPNGSAYFWPIPTIAYQFELELWTVLAQLATSGTTFGFTAPAYQDALTYSLAVALCPSYGKTVSGDLRQLLSQATESVRGLNSVAPRIATMDAGMPKGGRQRPYFNWLYGSSSNSNR